MKFNRRQLTQIRRVPSFLRNKTTDGPIPALRAQLSLRYATCRLRVFLVAFYGVQLCIAEIGSTCVGSRQLDLMFCDWNSFKLSVSHGLIPSHDRFECLAVLVVLIAKARMLLPTRL